MANPFQVGDWIASYSETTDFLGKRIEEFHLARGFTGRPVKYHHAEIIIGTNPDSVMTFSQTFPKAKKILYPLSDYLPTFRGESPTRDLYRLTEYDDWVTPQGKFAMLQKADEICKRKPTGKARFLAWIGVNYDFLQLPGYWLNHLSGSKKHINWLEIPGGVGTCSDKGAEVLDALLWAKFGYSPIFPDRPNSEVTPADISKEENFERVYI